MTSCSLGKGRAAVPRSASCWLRIALCALLVVTCILVSAPWRFLQRAVFNKDQPDCEFQLNSDGKGTGDENHSVLVCGNAQEQASKLLIIWVFAHVCLLVTWGVIARLLADVRSVYRASTILLLIFLALQCAIFAGSLIHRHDENWVVVGQYDFAVHYLLGWIVDTLLEMLLTTRASAASLAMRWRLVAVALWTAVVVRGAARLCLFFGLFAVEIAEVLELCFLAIGALWQTIATYMYLRIIYRLWRSLATPWGRQLIVPVRQTLSTAGWQLLCYIFVLFLRVAREFHVEDPWTFYNFFLLDTVMQSAVALFVSGVLRRPSADEKAAEVAEFDRQERWLQASMTYEACLDEEWEHAVEKLAVRGFSLAQLWQFYTTSLPEQMPHFNPSRHRTADVVRCAIIPASADPGDALATLLAGGQPVRPETMVTHNWSNLFRDLMAAIVADALGEPYYAVIADLLDNDAPKLKALLDPAALAKTYWVCALSVSQHHAICAENRRHTLDAVTGEEHPVCSCGQPKYFNTTPPLRADGKSIKCEMNKFDDMMAHLSASNSRFRQLVAIDREFELFGRAWCVAELAAADKMGMPQWLAMHSQKSLEEARESLQHLRIEEMRAARPEDIEEILSKIPDVESFNNHLQDMLFGTTGLLATSRHEDAMQMAGKAGRMAYLSSTLGPHSLRITQA